MPSRPDLFGIIVFGRMNPAIHHPAWYLNVELLDRAEYEEAINGEPMCAPFAAEFACTKFQVVCRQDYWEIRTNQREAIERTLELVRATFDDQLPQTPIGAYEFRFLFQRDTHVSEVGRFLGRRVLDMNLGFEDSGDQKARIGLQSDTTEGGVWEITLDEDTENLAAASIVSVFTYPQVGTGRFKLWPELGDRFHRALRDSDRQSELLVQAINARAEER